MCCAGRFEGAGLKATHLLPSALVFFSRLAVSVNVKEGGEVKQVGILSEIWKWSAFKLVASSREQQRAYPFHWLPVCATSIPVI